MAWIKVGKQAELQEGECKSVEPQGTRIAIYKVGGCVYATSDICTHQLAYMSEGYLDGEYIECPMHQGRFHVPTGKAMGAPVTKDLRVFPCKIDDGAIYVEVDR